MNRTEFIKTVTNAINENEEISYKVTQKMIREIMDIVDTVVYETVNADESVQPITGLTLTRVFKEARTARNPITGATVDCPAKYSPKAKFGKAFKTAINE